MILKLYMVTLFHFNHYFILLQKELLHLPPDSPAAQIFKQFTESSQNVGRGGTNLTPFTVLILLVESFIHPLSGN